MYKENLNDLKHYLIPKIVTILKIIVYLFIGIHLLLLSIFMSTRVYTMGVVNIFSVILYICLGFKLAVLNNHNKNNLIDDISSFSMICDTTLAELYIHMVLAVICLGWDSNFQVYCFDMIIFLMLGIYLTSSMKKAIGELVVICSSYFLLRLITSVFPPLYPEFGQYATTFDLLNTLLTLIFMSIIIISLSTIILDFEKHLAKTATFDRLTGLANRRYIDKLEYSVSKSCVAIMDIDDFKKVNDTYGHDAGDEVLKKLSDILKRYASENKALAAVRWGGEEFVLVYELNNQTYFTAIMSKIRKEVEESLIVSDTYAIQYTITVGVAYSNEASSYKDLIKLADLRLYAGKRQGKNRIITKG